MSGPIVFGGSQPTHGQTLGSVVFDVSDLDLELLQLDMDDVTCEALEVTNMKVLPTTTEHAHGNKIKIPSAYVDPGKLMLTINHDPTQYIPIGQPPETITVYIGPCVADQEQFVCFGFISKVKPVIGPLDGKVCTSQIEVTLTDDDSYDATGAVAWTTAS